MSPLPPLPEEEVHVWTLRLDGPADAARLSRADAEHAAALRHPESRRRYTATRAALRLLLGHYLACDGREVPLELGPFGKPALPSDVGLRFNLSHSREAALLAFARSCDVGVDLEAERALDPLRLARRCFSERELAELLALPEGERRGAFFRGWTRKEAFIKARGEGLAHPLRCFSVSLGEAPALLHHDDPAELERWRVWGAPAPPGFAAALVTGAGTWRVRWLATPAG